MTFNKEKLIAIAKPRSPKAMENAKRRKENKQGIRMSQEIILSLRYYMRIQNMSQKQLARLVDVSDAYIAKLMKGNENLTIDTIAKLQNAIGKPLVRVTHPYEERASLPVTFDKVAEQDLVAK